MINAWKTQFGRLKNPNHGGTSVWTMLFHRGAKPGIPRPNQLCPNPVDTYAPYSATSAVILNCGEAIQVDFVQAKGLTKCHNDVTEEIWEGVAVFCRLHMHCYASGTLTGTNTIQLQFPDLFQNMKYSVSTSAWDTDNVAAPPNLLKNVFGPTTPEDDQEDTTAQATALTGTKSAPTTLNFGLVRSKFMNGHSGRNATSFGIQTSYKGLVKEENKLGTSDGVHYVAFVFDVEESVYLKQYADKVEFITRIATMFTLLLSAMSGMKFMKSHLELLIDKCCMRRPLTEVPDDVRRRYKILNETNLARRHSIAIGGDGVGDGGGTVPQRQRRLSSRELMQQDKGKPKKQRRLSSRELMQQEQEGNNATAVDIGIELTAFGSEGSNGNMAYSNPMKKNAAKKGSGRRRHSSTSLSAFEAKTVNAKIGDGGGVNDKIKSMELKLEEQSREYRSEIEQIKQQIKLLLSMAAASQNAPMNHDAAEEDDDIEYFHDEETNSYYYIDGEGETHWKKTASDA